MFSTPLNPVVDVTPSASELVVVPKYIAFLFHKWNWTSWKVPQKQIARVLKCDIASCDDIHHSFYNHEDKFVSHEEITFEGAPQFDTLVYNRAKVVRAAMKSPLRNSPKISELTIWTCFMFHRPYPFNTRSAKSPTARRDSDRATSWAMRPIIMMFLPRDSYCLVLLPC